MPAENSENIDSFILETLLKRVLSRGYTLEYYSPQKLFFAGKKLGNRESGLFGSDIKELLKEVLKQEALQQSPVTTEVQLSR